MPFNRTAAPAIALALLALSTAGCGQKGALYLPDRPPQAVPAPASAPASAPAGESTPERKPKPPTGG